MTYKFRIYPNKQQLASLEKTVETCRLLYNQSLEERFKDKSLKYYEQKRNLTQKRKVILSMKRVSDAIAKSYRKYETCAQSSVTKRCMET